MTIVNQLHAASEPSVFDAVSLLRFVVALFSGVPQSSLYRSFLSLVYHRYKTLAWQKLLGDKVRPWGTKEPEMRRWHGVYEIIPAVVLPEALRE